ncbi:type I restriction-modification system subunit M/S [Marinobacterium iners]|uniref:type I restriction-modification system subunit M/S n=1 Tax=Marinobacterium iners TaxID=48076 RepID=UPI001A8E4739|nr:type I restriction-modification system subunit M/S [Marinobacterium iners]
MQHTNKNQLRAVAQLLGAQSFVNRAQIIVEVSLLATWACWSYKQFGDVAFHEQQPDIQYAYKDMSNRYPAGHVFTQSRLYEVCPTPLINQVVERLNMLDWADSLECIEYLLEVVREFEPDEPYYLLSDALGSLMADLVRPVIASDRVCTTALYHGMSLAALPNLKGTGSILVRVKEASPFHVAVCALLETPLEEVSSVYNSASDSASYIISVPPLGAAIESDSYRFSHEAGVYRAAKEMESRAVVLVPPSFLFQRSSSAIRELLIEDNLLEAVIGFPKGQLDFAAAPPVLLVLDKHREKGDPIQFYGLDTILTSEKYRDLVAAVHDRAPGSHGVLGTLDQVREKSYDLTVNRYFLDDATAAIDALEDTVSLDGVADIIRAQSLKSEPAQPSEPDSYIEVAIKDIDESGQLCSPDKCIKVDQKQQKRVNSQRLKAGDILLAIKGTVGRVALIGDNCGTNWIAGQAFVIIRPKKTVSGIYLYRFLSSDLVQQYLAERATGVAMKMLKAADVADIPIPLMSASTQAQVERNYRAIQDEYAAIHEHYDTIRRLKSEYWTLNTEQGAS